MLSSWKRVLKALPTKKKWSFCQVIEEDLAHVTAVIILQYKCTRSTYLTPQTYTVLYTNYISRKISYKKREKISGIGDMLGSYCYKYDWKASSSQSTESFDGHTKVIICQADETHSRILSQQVASLENCWERGAAAVDIALEESAGKGYFTYLLWAQGAVEILAGRKKIQNDSGQLWTPRRWDLGFVFWELGNSLVCASLLLLCPMMWLCEAILVVYSQHLKATPVFLPGESQGQRSLAGYSPWGHESDTT